ncbi:15-hydroxyprostaglandin dehydrogenase [NAD(+)]-like [Larimichthys crocea]|uniref:15-hydroxyprostaglandin dehydrogenase [NAD(+)]-like n=1 Tax=Larimichthys crocea TaxID=215358 RepID=UPI000F6027F3|nr:15-hydroxyprostaglandin dehydrogenase [NAD(+)]-like [Larimichthys crocea]
MVPEFNWKLTTNSVVFCLYAALQKTIEAFGGIDILCNNAGILNESQWEKTVSINLMGVVRVTYLALEHMNIQPGGVFGVIVLLKSPSGLGPLLSCPIYTATKHGVVSFTRAMAAVSTVSGYGMRINAVCRGPVQTDLFSNILNRLGQFSHLAGVVQKVSDITGVLK